MLITLFVFCVSADELNRFYSVGTVLDDIQQFNNVLFGMNRRVFITTSQASLADLLDLTVGGRRMIEIIKNLRGSKYAFRTALEHDPNS